MSAASWLFWAGVMLVALGIPAGCVQRLWRPALVLQAGGATLVGAAGAAVAAGAAAFGSGFHDSLRPAFGVDRLSGFFLALLATVAVPACWHARGGLTGVRGARALAALTGAFLLALIGFATARDATTFLAFWELMTLLPATMTLVARSDEPARRGVFYYVAVTHIGGAGVWVAMLMLARHGALAGAQITSGGTQALVIGAAIIGFATKAGLAPLHSWLPRAHPLAPPHVSALMSGVMVKFALYGLIRVLFQWAAPAPLWAGVVLLGLGATSTVAGIANAVFQHELKRLLAFCTIENIGVITLGLGASLAFAAAGHPDWSAIAFAAALLQMLSHALGKGLLFLAAGSIASRVGAGGLELDQLGGLLRRMPWTGAAVLVGAMTLAGTPPFGGFAAEWLTLQSLLHLGHLHTPGLAVAGAVTIIALGSGIALAAVCFVAVIGLVLLGSPRRAEVERASETRANMWVPLTVMATACVALGVVPGLLVPALARLAPGAPHAAVSGPLRPGFELPGTGAFPALGMSVALVVVVGLLWRLARRPRSEPTGAWACGQQASPALAWTAAGFTKPVRLMFEGLLRPRRQLVTVTERGVLQDISYRGEVPHLFDTHVYEPVIQAATRAAARIRRLQSGSLRAYLGYLVALVVLLLMLLRLGWPA